MPKNIIENICPLVISSVFLELVGLSALWQLQCAIGRGGIIPDVHTGTLVKWGK